MEKAAKDFKAYESKGRGEFIRSEYQWYNINFSNYPITTEVLSSLGRRRTAAIDRMSASGGGRNCQYWEKRSVGWTKSFQCVCTSHAIQYEKRDGMKKPKNSPQREITNREDVKARGQDDRKKIIPVKGLVNGGCLTHQ